MQTLRIIGTTTSGKQVIAFGQNTDHFTKADHSEACDFFASAAFQLNPNDMRRKALRAKSQKHFNLSK